MYSKECVEYFLEHQGQLFDYPVANNMEEAREFLEDVMAAVLKSIKEVREYLEEMGLDVASMSLDEIRQQSEVFSLPNGEFLIVEG